MTRTPEPVDPASDLSDSPGFLTEDLGRVELNLLLELYLRDLIGRGYNEVEAVYLYGSALLDDLAPGAGDVDLLVTLRRTPGRALMGELEAIHGFLSQGRFDPWGAMLEVTYLTARSLAGGEDAPGFKGDRHGVEETRTKDLRPIARYMVRDHGRAVYGKDRRHTWDPTDFQAVFEEVMTWCRAVQDLGAGLADEDLVRHYTGLARALLLLETHKLVSKTEAVAEVARRYPGKIADGVKLANRLRRGEDLRTTPLDKGFGPFLEAIVYEAEKAQKHWKRHAT